MNKEIVRIDKKLTGELGQVFNRFPICEKDKSRRVILEIGPGETPFPIFGEKKMRKNEYYIGTDIDPNKIEDTVNLLNLVGFPKDKAAMMAGGVRKFIRRDGNISKVRFPFREGSVGEVIMCNIVGDPRIMEVVGEIMEDATRVLEPKGEIIVVQTRAYLYPIRDLELSMGRFGFELTKKNIYDKKEINKYRPTEENEGEYVIKFSRVQPR